MKILNYMQRTYTQCAVQFATNISSIPIKLVLISGSKPTILKEGVGKLKQSFTFLLLIILEQVAVKSRYFEKIK